MATVVNIAKNFTSLGEGPHWDHVKQRLLFVDIDEAKIHRWDYATSKFATPVTLEDPTVGAVVPREKGGLVAAASHRFASIDEESGHVQTLVRVTDNTNCRFNDGKCDPKGRFWAGTMGLEKEPATPVPTQGELFSLGTDFTLQKHLSNVEISNGLSWTQDSSRMFYTDSLLLNIRCFKYDADAGTISDPTVVVEFSREKHGIPDGHTIDSDGNIWVSMYGGGAILKVDTTKGEIVKKVKISDSALRTTSCCFGGPNFDEMFVTSARYKEHDFKKGMELGESGSLFKVTGLGVRGLPANSFQG